MRSIWVRGAAVGAVVVLALVGATSALAATVKTDLTPGVRDVFGARAHAAADGNVIANGTFSNGIAGWRAGKPRLGRLGARRYPTITASRNVHCFPAQIGDPFLQLDVPAGSDGYAEQTFVVPKHPGPLTFRDWGNLQPVHATVSVITADGTRHTLLAYTPPTLQATPSTCSGAKPQDRSLSMKAFAGKRVTLRFEATSHGNDGTIADFDDVALAPAGAGHGGPPGGGTTTVGPPPPTCAHHAVTLRGGISVEAGCLTKHKDGDYTATGGLYVNGLNIGATGSLTVNPTKVSVSADGQVYVRAGPFLVYRGKSLSWSLNVSKTLSVPKGLKIKGLPVSGSVTVGFNAGVADAKLNGLVDARVVDVTGEIDLHMTAASGLQLNSLKLAVSSDIPLRGLTLKNASLSYERKDDSDVWTGAVSVALPSGPTVAGTLTLTDGSVTAAGATVSGINKPIGEIAFLQSVGLDVKLQPISVTGSIGLTAGPKLFGYSALGIDGSLTVTFGPPGPPAVITATGTASIVDQQLASATVTATIPSSVSFDGKFGKSFAGIDVSARIGGTVSRTDLEADGSATVKFGPLSGDGFAAVNTTGVAACATAKVFAWHVSGGGAYRWSGHHASVLDGSCGMSEVKGAIGAQAVPAAGAGRRLRLPRHLAQVNILVDGTAGAPAVRLTAHGHSTIVQPGTTGRFAGGAYVAIDDAAGARTAIAFAHPPAGRLAVAGAGVRSIHTTVPLRRPSVRVRLTRLRGGRYRAAFRAARITGQRLVFYDADRSGGTRLRSTAAHRGTIMFAPRDRGVRTPHTLRVVVTQYGLPRLVVRAARFRPPTVNVRRPRRVTIALHHRTARIDWTRVRHATGYRVTVSTSDGRRLFYRVAAKHHSVAVRAAKRVTARVRAIGPGGRVSRATSATRPHRHHGHHHHRRHRR